MANSRNGSFGVAALTSLLLFLAVSVGERHVHGAAASDDLPGSPALSATAGDRQVVLGWDAPPAGAFPVLRYEYRWKPHVAAAEGAFGAWTNAGTALGVTVSGLLNGVTYTFEVRAVNSAGAGVAALATATPGGADEAAGTARSGLPERPVATVVAGDRQAVLRWDALPAGAFSVSRYEYRWKSDAAAAEDAFGAWANAGMALGVTVSGLLNGVTYTFEVRAVSPAGAGEATSVTTTPLGGDGTLRLASVPRLLAAAAADGEVRLTWEAPADDGGGEVERYAYRVRADDGRFGDWIEADGASSTVVSGLTNGVRYIFEVRAETAAGVGAVASASAMPVSVGVPGAPRLLLAEALPDGGVTLLWTPPSSDGGAAIVRYEVRWRLGDGEFGAWRGSGVETAATFGGLAVGQDHTFEVRAVNAVGAGESVAAAVRPARPPAAPASLVAQPAAGLVRLAWTAPADDGGAAVAGYEYRWAATGGEFGAWVAAGFGFEASVGGLDNGVEHVFEVRALNGSGAGTSLSARATPEAARVPSAPGLEATGGVGSVALAWTVPADDGGSPIRRYEYRWKPDGDAFGQWQSVALGTEVTVERLPNGVAHVFEVRAVNDLGSSAAATATAVPADVPGAPVLTLVARLGAMELEWSAPEDDGGLDILGYEYRWHRAGGPEGAWTAAAEGALSAVVRELDDGVEYAFAVRAVNGRGEGPAATATAVLSPGASDDVVLDAWLARFARVAGGHVVDAVDSRLRVRRDVVSNGARRERGPERDETDARDDRGVHGAPPDRRVRHRGGVGGRAPTTAWSGFAAGALGWGQAATPGVGADVPMMRLAGAALGGGRWVAWGQLDASHLAGEQERLGLDGMVATATVGADYEEGAMLAGIALAQSVGRGDFRLLATPSQPERADRAVESRLIGAYPYLRVARGAFSAWGLLGRGAGSVVLSGQGARVSHDIGSTLGAFGARSTLVSVAGLELALKSDAFLGRLVTADDAVQSSANRMRLLVEGSRSATLDSGARLTLIGEFGGRHDAGSAERGGGIEVGGGFEYGGRRLEVAGRARSVLLHGDASLRDFGAMMSVALKARPSGRGLSLRLTPTWGNVESGVERMWGAERTNSGMWSPEADPGAGVVAELGYGMDALRGRALAFPYAGFDTADDRRTFRLGWRLVGTRGHIEIEALRHTAAERTGNGLLVRLTFTPWAAQ